MATNTIRQRRFPSHWTLRQRIYFYMGPADPETGCRNWQGRKRLDGAGEFKMGGTHIKAHRAVWIIERGPIPKGKCVRQSCRNHACGEIEHLFLGTYAEISADKVRDGRQSRGETHGTAKLTEAQALQVFRMPGTHRSIASVFGVGKTIVGAIKAKKKWRHMHPVL